MTDERYCFWCMNRVSLELVSTVYDGELVWHGACFEEAEKMARLEAGER